MVVGFVSGQWIDCPLAEAQVTLNENETTFISEFQIQNDSVFYQLRITYLSLCLQRTYPPQYILTQSVLIRLTADVNVGMRVFIHGNCSAESFQGIPLVAYINVT